MADNPLDDLFVENVPDPEYARRARNLIGFYDRPSLAASNLLDGDLDASFRSMFQPESLSPVERRMLAEKFNFKSDVLKVLTDVVTNPLVLIGSALSIKYPLREPGSMFNAGNRAKQLAKKLGMERFFGTPFTIYTDDVSRPMVDMMEGKIAYQDEFSLKMGEAFGLVHKKSGQFPTRQEIWVMNLLGDGEHTNRGYIGKLVKFLEKETGLKAGKGPLLDEGAVRRWMGDKKFNAVKEAMAKYQEVDWEMYSRVPPEYRAEFIATLNSRGFDARHLYTNLKGAERAKYKLGEKLEFHTSHHIKGFQGIYQFDKYDPNKIKRFMKSQASDPIEMGVVARRGVTLPDLEALEQIKEVVNPRMYELMHAYNRKYADDWARDVAFLFDKTGGEPGKLAGGMKEMLTKKYGVWEEQAEAVAQRLSGVNSRASMQQEMKRIGLQFGQVPQYSLDLDKNVASYINHSAATVSGLVPVKGETVPPLRKLRDQLDVLKASYAPGDKMRAQMLEEQYIPLLMGRRTIHQVGEALTWQNYKLSFYEAASNPKFAELMKKVPGGKKAHKFLLDTFGNTDSWLSPGSMGSAISTWLYLGALGFNPTPAMVNLMQPFITSMNLYGVKDTLAGMKRAMAGFMKYPVAYAEGKGKGLSVDEADKYAMRKIFPLFEKHVLSQNPQMRGELMETTRPLIQKGLRKFAETGQRSALFVFGGTERWNRVVAFESGMNSAFRRQPEVMDLLAKGLTGQAEEAAGKLAAQGVRMTMFPAGVLGIPHMMLEKPTVFRQFTQFPLRMLDFVSSTMWNPEGKLDLGTLGRAMRNSALAYEVGKGFFNVDLGRGLFAEAFPVPQEGRPFYPFPLVPPAIGMLGSVGSAVFSGDYEKLPAEMMVGVPGGLAARRFYRTLHPSRADYSKYEQTGMIPLYDSKGSLVDNYTPFDLFLKSIGVNRADDTARQQMVGYLVKQRELLVDYRRRYLNSVAKNDYTEAEKIQAEFQQQYPGMGPLRIKKSDIKAIQKRREITRLQRVLQSMPSEYRGEFGKMVSMAISQEMGQSMEQGPEAVNTLVGY